MIAPTCSTAPVPKRPTLSIGWLESWILTLTIAGYPVVAAASQLMGVDNRPLSIGMRALLLIICCVVLLKFPARGMSRKNLLFWTMWWLFWTAYLTRLGFDTVFMPVALPLPNSEYWIFAIGTCLIPAVAASCGNTTGSNEWALRKSFWWLAAGAILNLPFVLIQVSTGEIDTLRVETDVLNPIALGHIGISIILLSAWQLNEGKISNSRRIAIYAACAIAVFIIFASASKGPILSLLLSLAAYACMRPRKFLSRHFALTALLLLCAAVLGFSFIQNSFIFARMSEGIFGDGVRLALISEAFQLIQKSPLIGAGIEPLETYPHNLVIESFLSAGVFTGFSFCMMLAIAFTRIIALARAGASLWIPLLFIQYCLAAMFSGSLYGSYIFWVLMVMVIAQPIKRHNTVVKFKMKSNP